ncbi:MAG: hypothetical protein IAE81_02050 [Caldilineaceae bacterium]|nr:hypothetical protein [Caldilineaceae bacterium]
MPSGMAPGLWLILLALWLTACTRTAPFLPATPPTVTPPTATAPPLAAATLPVAQALPALVLAERTAAGARDLTTLRQLWAEDARIVDSRGTLDPADDYIWDGRDAILDRYALAVFAVPPPPFTEPPAFDVTRTGDAAAASLGADRWRFRFDAGRWWLQELAY